MDIVFLLSHIPNPRMNKRIGVAKVISESGLISWDKQAYDMFEVQHKDIKNIIIKIKASGTEPLKRIIKTMRYAFNALYYLRQFKPKCIYVGNIDMLFIAYIYSIGKKTKIIYEVGDLNKIIIDEPKNLKLRVIKKLLVFLETQLSKRITYIVLTSEKFYIEYYSQFIPPEKKIVMPNMPNLEAFKNYSTKKNGRFTIGFIGGIRYINQMKMMIDVAEKLDIDVLIAGAGFSKNDENELRVYCRNKEFVNFYGRFQYMSDVADLYGRCDCIYSVYDAELNNVKLALPNKLYESIYCRIPIIVAKKTYLSELVEELGVGVAVSHKNEIELEEVLKKMIRDNDYYNSFVEACHVHKDKVDVKSYNENLSKRIKELVI